ncbi:MAG TPA: spermidine synthase [Allosphingosinicella sp.]|jgi:spermidine synthase
MLPRHTLDTAPIPGGGELRLVRRGDEYSIMLGANELMNSRRSGSEEALARLACAKLGKRARARVLIGGLGMGFTLRAALAALGPDAEVVVAEIVPAVVAWARGPMAALHGGTLDDPRVRIAEEDVARSIASAPSAWDAILLDVDNGPDGLTLEANDRLYAPAGLALARTALRPGGILAIWSAHSDAAFAARLRRAGFRVEEHDVRTAGGRRGARHVVWIAEAGRAPAG